MTSEKGIMKKILTTGILALAVAALYAQTADAWINSKFGIGLNWNYQSGGNNLLWGAFRNGQPPAPDCGTCPGGPGGIYPGAAPFHGYLQQPGAEQGGFTGSLDAAPSPANAVPGRTQSYSNRTYNGQTVNYQYPYQGYTYPNYYNYNYYYGYGR